jgi:hypothetical protein
MANRKHLTLGIIVGGFIAGLLAAESKATGLLTGKKLANWVKESSKGTDAK